MGEGKKINAFFFSVQLRFIDARVTLTYKRERVPSPSGWASLPSEPVGGGGGAKGVHLHPGAEKVVDFLEGVMLFPEIFDQVLIIRMGLG